jgi:cell division topological specificity factor
MIDFLQRLFGKPASSATAKERLRLVLMSDHLSLAPDMVEAMKRDLVDVISRYVQVDLSKIEVNFEQQDRALALLANIPIVSVNRGGGDGDDGGEPERKDEPQDEPVAASATAESMAVKPAQPAQGGGSSKRRKKKSGGGAPSSRPATAN